MYTTGQKFGIITIFYFSEVSAHQGWIYLIGKNVIYSCEALFFRNQSNISVIFVLKNMFIIFSGENSFCYVIVL